MCLNSLQHLPVPSSIHEVNKIIGISSFSICRRIMIQFSLKMYHLISQRKPYIHLVCPHCSALPHFTSPQEQIEVSVSFGTFWGIMYFTKHLRFDHRFRFLQSTWESRCHSYFTNREKEDRREKTHFIKPRSYSSPRQSQDVSLSLLLVLCSSPS